MATETIKPNGDITTGWTPFGGAGDHYTRVDNGVSTPDDTAGVQGSGFQSEIFDFENPAAQTVPCTSITVNVRAKVGDAAVFDLTVKIFDGSTQIGDDGATDYLETSYSNYAVEFTGFSKTYAELSDFRVELYHEYEIDAYVTEVEAVLSFEYSTSTENTILSALKTALETITTTNGYETGVAEVINGPTVIADHINRPSIGIYCDRRERKNISHGRSESTLHVWLTGYVDAQHRDFDNLWALSADIERVLDTSGSWAYSEFTDMKNFNYYFGGAANEKVGILQTELEIKYRYDFGSP